MELPDALEELGSDPDELPFFLLLPEFLLHCCIYERLRLPWAPGPIDSPEKVSRRKVLGMVVREEIFHKRVLLKYLSVHVLHQQRRMVWNGHCVRIAILDVLE